MKNFKATLDQLFKNGKNFQFSKTDYSTAEVSRKVTELKEVHEENQNIINPNVNDLKKMVFQ